MASITLQGNKIDTTGNLPENGSKAVDFSLAANDLSIKKLADFSGNRLILNIFPSVDTGTCATSVREFNKKAAELNNTKVLCISRDLPFAQGRFAKEAKIDNVTFLSDYRGGDFGKTHGLLLEGPHVLARSVMVVDKHNVLRYIQVTPDLAHMPDMEAAFQAARSLVDQG